MTQNPDALAMARRIAADQVIRMDDSQRGYNTAADFLSGEHDEFSLAIQCALAAILETRELSATRITALEADLAEARVKGWAEATAWHKHGIAWKHLELISQEELLADARALLTKLEGK